ncbi:MAG: DUF4118 domain-containing protein [Lachnospiraceae bacterium]|nr:DUF4118 domain-containing protein [Lachnospiraceae bacterium]
MERYDETAKDLLFTMAVLTVSFLINVFIQRFFLTPSLIPTIFVLGVFLVSLKTRGYLWGVLASLLSVVAVNYAFTYPYYAFGFSLPESLPTAVIMLIVATMTSTLTTKVKAHEKMKAETEREKMRANLLRAISHDLRTPLTSIYGSTSAIIDNYDILPKEQQIRLLEEVRGDSQWLIRMVENLLSVTRIDGGKVQVMKVSTVLEELIDATLIKFRKQYPNQEVQVSIPEEFISIPMDAMLMEQVLINLLENAVLHAKGMTELSLTVRTSGNRAVFEVADNGCGIARDKIGKLFTGYLDRGSAIADGQRNNMGIGLSVCATIVKAHGGVIEAENRKSGGAVFRFSLEMEELSYEQ